MSDVMYNVVETEYETIIDVYDSDGSFVRTVVVTADEYRTS